MEIRARVLTDEPLCRACQAEDRVTAAAEVDHIVPLHKGGTDERSNLQALCVKCHEAKTYAELGYTPLERVGLDGWPVDPAGGGGSTDSRGIRETDVPLDANTNRPKSGVDFAPPMAVR